MRSYLFLFLISPLLIFSCQKASEKSLTGTNSEHKVKLGYYSCDTVSSRIHYRTMIQQNNDSVFFLRYCEDSTAWTKTGQIIKMDHVLCREYTITRKDSSNYSFIKTDSMRNGVERKQYLAKEHRDYMAGGKKYSIFKFVPKSPSMDERGTIFWNADLGFIRFRYCDWCDNTQLMEAADKISGDDLRQLHASILSDSLFYYSCE
jgi:hypothetical protein